jgi:outer membrane protein assembly factor BamB
VSNTALKLAAAWMPSTNLGTSIREFPISRSPCARRCFRLLGRQVLIGFLGLLALGSLKFSAADDTARAKTASERIHRYRPALVATRKVAESLSVAGPSKASDNEVLRVGQAVLDLEMDSFSDELLSVRSSIESRFRTAPEEFRRKYETLYGAEANRLLAEAVAESSAEKLQQVSRRFFLTAAGYTAAERLVALWLDSGEFDRARRLANLLLSDSVHQARVTPQLRRLAATLEQIGEEVGRIKPPANGPSRVEAAGSQEFHRRFAKSRANLMPLEAGWMLLGGSSDRSRVVQGSAPVPTVSWKSDFFLNQSHLIVDEFLKDWESRRREADQPCSPASYPILVDGLVVFRDSAGLRAVNAVNGATEWSYSCGYNLTQAAENRVDRFTQRRVLSGIEISMSPNAFGENSLMGAISSNGQLIFSLDSMTAADPGGFQRQFANRLIALRARGADASTRVAWIHEGQLPERLIRPGGPRQFTFLGPPLPCATELLCLTEHDIEVHLTALAPYSGEVLWTQPLCTIERHELFELDRHETACLPAQAEGILVSPTNSGLLVAYDQARMCLLWAMFVDDLPDPRRLQTRTTVRTQPFGYAGYASHLMISSNRVLYLPPRSGQLHCLDLTTGRIIWSVARGDAEYVGAVAHGQVLIIGRQFARSLSLEDGRSIWEVPTGIPSGRGIAVADRYLLPLEGGRLASLDLATGRNLEARALRSDVPLGHLVADQDRVYSLSQRGLAAYLQVDHVLSEAGVADAGGTGPTQLAGQNRDLLLAEVAIVQEHRGEAERQLSHLMKIRQSDPDRERTRRDLKELLFDKIATGAGVSRGDHELLEQLLQSPVEEFRYLIAASTRPDVSLNEDMLARLAARAYDLDPQWGPLPVQGDENWRISSAVWCRLQMDQPVEPRFGTALLALQQERSPHAARPKTPAELKRYVRVFDSKPGIAAARSELALRMAELGSVHAAETLWLRNKSSDDAEVAAEASMRLADLWEHAGFVSDAATELQLVVSDHAGTRLPGGKLGADYVQALANDRPAKLAWRQSQAPRWPVDHVEIRQTTVEPEFVQQLLPPGPGREQSRFQSERIEIASLGRQFRSMTQPIDYVMSSSEVEDELILSIFDQRSRLRLGSVSIPITHQMAPISKQVAGGHLVPFGVPGGVLGISTMQLGDGEPAWKQSPADLVGWRSPVVPGPSGPDFVSFVWRNRLYVVDPLDGAVLWQRIVPSTSHESSPSPGLDVIGDRQALAVRSSDRTSYDVFETATGRKISTVRPGFVMGQWQGAHGRFVAGFAETSEGRRLQIRDLLSESPSVNELVGEVTRQPMLYFGDLIYMGAGGEIKIFDMAKGEKKLSVQLEASELLPIGALRVFFDRTRYFVNLQRHTQVVMTSNFNQPINSQVSSIGVRDDLYAYSRVDGELLWKRSLPNRTILQFPESQVPFLVTISHVKDRVNNSLQSLTIEVIDATSGATIGFRENLRVDHLLSAQYDGDSGRILLRGQASDIELSFGPAEGQTQAGR